ncbi:hypothetical protein DPEC_G00236820 [Dallia pectoralis]|uniref:Uncharacterized protein n=1 Tax=Dallia pectoralis TaxID=75939 RepID=A0ACC2FYA6_DALPE|nr:hypothetical protein DPEC_G00236820 [Dallia pectoralis]
MAQEGPGGLKKGVVLGTDGRREMILLLLATFPVVITLEQRNATFCNLTQESDMISESRLSSVCLSHGEIVVTCNATGDRLRFSWTLNSQILNRTVASGENYSSVSTLKADVPGVLTCMVQNEVSSSNSTITLPTCPVIMCIKRRCIKLIYPTSGQYAEVVFRSHDVVKKDATATEAVEYGRIKIDASSSPRQSLDSHGSMEKSNQTQEKTLVTFSTE